MTLYDICKKIAIIEDGLAYGEIDFSCDKLVCAMKSGHPADVLDDILSIIGWDVFAGKTPTIKKVKETLSGLIDFQESYGVDLSEPISELQKYVKGEEKK